ncbi:GAF domain-containing protein [candidate division KSB1 bacterium]|nr:GAF domain-containing protein [candidate division KSB1 bacterium]
MNFNLNQVGNKLRDVIEILNDVADFERHAAFLLINRQERLHKAWQHQWHYLHGFINFSDSIPRDFLTDPTSSLNLTISGGKTLFCKESYRSKYENSDRGPELFLPLKAGNHLIGVLVLGAEKGRSFSTYIQWLCEQVVSLGMAALTNASAAELWEKLRYSMLNRKYFFAGVPSLERVLEEYMQRSIELLSANIHTWGTLRLVEEESISPISGSDEITLVYRTQSGLSQSKWKAIYRKSKQFQFESIRSWLDGIESRISSTMPDIDSSYANTFARNSRSHLVIPALCDDTLVALFTFDSNQQNAFDQLSMVAIAILAAHAAPVIANARSRTQTEAQRDWLQAVVDGIADELIVVDETGKILLANKEKKRFFPDLKIGKPCHEVLEKRLHKCPGCHTIQAINSKTPIKQASWEYKYQAGDCAELRHVEITTGPVEISGDPIGKAVEIVRDVTPREKMLQWFERLHRKLPQKNLAWLYSELVRGLHRNVGFGRARLYIRKTDGTSDRFMGEAADPKHTENPFKNFYRDIDQDAPSRILVELKRPVHFIVNTNGKKAGPEKGRVSKAYVRYHIDEMPESCRTQLDKGDLDQWVELPLLWHGGVIGKIAVDNKGRKNQRGEEDTSFSTWDMALLTMFTRFASIAVQLVIQQDQQRQAFKRHLKEVEILRSIDERLITGLPRNELLRLIVEQAEKLVGPCSSIIRLCDPTSNFFDLCVQKRSPGCPGRVPDKVEFGDGASGRAALEKKAVLLEDTRNDASWRAFIEKYTGEERKLLDWIGSSVGVPLIFRNNLLGTLAVAKPEPFGFKDADIVALQLLAAKAAATLEYSRLQKAKTDFVAHASHSLKDPLVPLRTYIELLRTNQVDDPDLKEDYFSKILKAVHIFDRITGELLKASEIEIGIRKERTAFSVNDVVGRAIEEVQALTNVPISRKMGAVNYVVLGSAARLEEIIKGLLDNAIKYSGKNPVIDVLITNRDSNIVIEVRDRGIGMTNYDLAHAFEPFFRGSAEKRLGAEEISGTGLGLHICQHYVSAMDGKIEIESKPAGGTRVIVTLPLAKLPAIDKKSKS